MIGALLCLAVAATAFLLIRQAKQPAPHAGIPDADWKDEKSWKSTPEYKTVMDELIGMAQDVDAQRGPTAGEAAVLIQDMHSPHYKTREMAAIVAGSASSDPARSVLISHVLSLLSDPVSLVRMSAANSLGRMGDKSVIPYLEPLLKDRPAVAKIAQQAILKLQEEGTVPGK